MRISNINLSILLELDYALIVVVLLKDNFIIIDCVLIIVNCALIELN